METKDSKGGGGVSGLGSNSLGSGGGGGGFEPFPKLPSFQSQFHGYNDQLMADGTPIPHTGLPPSISSLQTVAMSPASLSVSSPGMMSIGSPLTHLTGLQTSITPPSTSFGSLSAATATVAPPPPNAFHHPLSAVNTMHSHHRPPYPLVPAPLQASTTSAYCSTLDDSSRHHLLYQSLGSSYAAPPSVLGSTSSHTSLMGGSSSNNNASVTGTTSLTNSSLQSQSQQHLDVMMKKDNTNSPFDLNNVSGNNSNATPLGMHTPTPSYDGSTTSSMMDTSNGAGYHTPHSTHTTTSSGPLTPHTTQSSSSHTPHTTQPHTPTPSTTTPIKIEKVLNSPIARVDARKKERRKNRASSLESSADSEASAMDVDPSNPGQVDAVSSTANFKSPLSALGMGDSNDTNGEKQVSKQGLMERKSWGWKVKVEETNGNEL